MVDILELLKGGDTPRQDQLTFLKAQILFWLIWGNGWTRQEL